jgi:hypothetical protein
MSYQWNPTAGYVEQANVTRLAREWHGCHQGVADALGRQHSLVLGRGAVTDLNLCRGIPPLQLMRAN